VLEREAVVSEGSTWVLEREADVLVEVEVECIREGLYAY
jgi:hypothetical protein